MSEMRLLEHTRQFVVHPLPRLRSLPTALPLEGVVCIELEEGMPVFRASGFIQARIEELLLKEREARLSVQEKKELDQWEEMDDYLSLINRVVRNLMQVQCDEWIDVSTTQNPT